MFDFKILCLQKLRFVCMESFCAEDTLFDVSIFVCKMTVFCWCSFFGRLLCTSLISQVFQMVTHTHQKKLSTITVNAIPVFLG
jgi:hypothetical protein